MSQQSYDQLLDHVLSSTAVPRRLLDGPAIVLERVARGGGATAWYYCKDADRLEALKRLLKPGSVVSFYFDSRLHVAPQPEDLEPLVVTVLEHELECVVGALRTHTIEFTIDFVSSVSEWSEFVGDAVPFKLLMAGPFPSRENDGVKAITLTLPDTDGTTRCHPH